MSEFSSKAINELAKEFIIVNVKKEHTLRSTGCHIFILFLGTHISKSVNKCDTHKFIIFSQSEVKSVLKDEEQEGMERFLAMKKL